MPAVHRPSPRPARSPSRWIVYWRRRGSGPVFPTDRTCVRQGSVSESVPVLVQRTCRSLPNGPALPALLKPNRLGRSRADGGTREIAAVLRFVRLRLAPGLVAVHAAVGVGE